MAQRYQHEVENLWQALGRKDGRGEAAEDGRGEAAEHLRGLIAKIVLTRPNRGEKTSVSTCTATSWAS